MAFHHPQKILFRHCDPAGIVFYPRYFEMINDTVEAWFDQDLGHSFEDIHGFGKAAVPTARIETTFKAPSKHGDHLIISLSAIRLGRSSLDLSFEAKAGEEVRFSASSTLVYVNDSGRPVSWPDHLRAAIERHLDLSN